MNAEQVNLAGLIVALFALGICIADIIFNQRAHWLWLLLLLAGTVTWAVTL